MIASEVVRAIEAGRRPLLLTGRAEHLQYFATRLAWAAAQDPESRVILATGSYIGYGSEDTRLDTLLKAMPIS